MKINRNKTYFRIYNTEELLEQELSLLRMNKIMRERRKRPNKSKDKKINKVITKKLTPTNRNNLPTILMLKKNCRNNMLTEMKLIYKY